MACLKGWSSSSNTTVSTRSMGGPYSRKEAGTHYQGEGGAGLADRGCEVRSEADTGRAGQTHRLGRAPGALQQVGVRKPAALVLRMQRRAGQGRARQRGVGSGGAKQASAGRGRAGLPGGVGPGRTWGSHCPGTTLMQPAAGRGGGGEARCA